MRVVNYKSLLLVLTQIIEVNDIQYGSKQSKSLRWKLRTQVATCKIG